MKGLKVGVAEDALSCAWDVAHGLLRNLENDKVIGNGGDIISSCSL